MTESTPIPSSDAKALLELGLSDEVDDTQLIDAVQGRLPGLDVEEVLGRGGMGVVYLARQTSLRRQVAVKVLNPELAQRPEFAARFQQEAQILGALRHPGIVEVYDVSESDGLFYIVMAPVFGGSLREQMLERTPTHRVRLVLRHLCQALGHAHALGVIHRDIKPENVLVDARGHIRVVDFGLAKLTSGPNLSLTATLSAAGTLLYMAPEQLEGRGAIGPATDIYSLGVLAYEMLTGQLPVGRFGPPSAEGADSAELDAIVMACLERDPQRRYPTAEALLQALDGALPVPAAAVRPPPRPAPQPAAGQDPIWMVFTGAIVCCLVAFMVLVVQEGEVDDLQTRQCITAFGQTACGYDCVADRGQVVCAPEPGMECLAAHGMIECGYDCVEGGGDVACAPTPEMTCAAGGGALQCGNNCRSARGGVVCDVEPPPSSADEVADSSEARP